jgi:septum formation protein
MAILSNLKNRQLTLGSASPRRKQLLGMLDIEFAVEIREVDENLPSELKLHEAAEYLALKKAEAFRHDLGEHQIVVTADTIVCLDDLILNKPTDRDDILRMLSLLENRTHTVYTGVCILSPAITKVFHDATRVTFGPLSQAEKEHYADVHKPFDKAGAYGAQDFIGAVAITKLEGSYFNVMGLPIHLVYKELTLI